MSVFPMHPGISNTANPAGGKIGRLLSNDFTIIVQQERVRYSLNRWGDVTGAGDAHPVKRGNRMIDGMYVFIGQVVEGAIGIANMIDPAKNPATGVQVIMSSGRKHTVNLLIVDLYVDRSHQGFNVPMVMTCQVTATAPSGIEGTV